jgi:polyisoprenoid-binding protein YceI
MRARVHVFTFKQGLLARLAHDLRLSVARFEIHLDHDQVHATFDADSLRVDGVAHGDSVEPDALTREDKAKIEETVRTELLHSAAHPRIELKGTLKRDGAAVTVDGELRLRGQSQGLRVPVKVERERTFAEVELSPSRFGIPPYKALAGAIRLQDRVVVRVELLEQLDKLEALASSGEMSVFEPA